MKVNDYKKNLFFYGIFAAIVLGGMFSCQKAPENNPEETILVNIDNKVTISKNEFIRRVEYTIRPPYCKGDGYIHKKIILNSLIAEKLLALEASDTSALAQDDEFQRFVKGRKEQAMRQWMRHVEATDKVTPDSSGIKKYYKFAGREYKIAYFATNDTAGFEQMHQILKTSEGDSAFPTRTVKWRDSESFPVLEALFGKHVEKGQILPPVKVGNDEFLVMKVLAWTDTKAITGRQMHERLSQVKERFTTEKAGKIWESVVAEIMKGKTLDFNRPIFQKMSEIFYQLYFKTSEEKKKSIEEHIWDMEQDSALVPDKMALQRLLTQPFFTIDDQVWTVDDFRIALMSHPLVFRNRHTPSTEFAKEFRLAIVDLVRDRYVTEQAYKKRYDQVSVVIRNAAMWRDAYLAEYQKHKYLQSIQEGRRFDKHFMSIIGKHLNNYVDSLQQKYYHKIQLNVDEFESIPLTRIDVLVKQKDQPYQYVVPRFPVLTTDNLIEYTIKMQGK
jgi:hypothetical protein